MPTHVNPEAAPALAAGVLACAAADDDGGAFEMLTLLVRIDPDLAKTTAERAGLDVRIITPDHDREIQGTRPTLLVFDELTGATTSAADRLEALVHERMQAGDMRGAVAALELLGGEDLDRAGRLHETITGAIDTLGVLRAAGVSDDGIQRMIDEAQGGAR